MAGESQSVQIDVIAAVADAQAQMGIMARSFDQALRGIRQSFLDTNPATEQHSAAIARVGSAHTGLAGILRDFRQEQVVQGRMARFYATELASIIPAAEGSKTAIQGLLGLGLEGLMGGLSFGFALEGIKLAVQYFVGLNKEAKAFAATLAELEKAKPYEGLQPDKAFEALQKAKQRPAAELSDLYAGANKIRAQIEAGPVPGETDWPTRLLTLQGALVEYEKKIRTLQGALVALNAQYEASKAKTAGGNPEAERAAGMEEAGKRSIKILTEQGTQAAKAAEDAANRRAALQDQFDQKDVAATKWAEDQKNKAREDAAKRAAEILAAQKKQRQLDLDEEVKSTERAEKTREADAKAALERGDKIIREAARAAQEDTAIAARKWVEVAQGMSYSVGRGFTDILLRGRSLEEGFSTIFDGIYEAFAQMVEKMIAEFVLSGLLSMLGSVIGGPVGGYLGGLAGKVGTFDVGTLSVPRTMLAVVHEGERIIPAAQNNPTDLAMLHGGGGGTSVQVSLSFPAVVGRDAYEAFRRNETAIVRVIGDAVRAGRLS